MAIDRSSRRVFSNVAFVACASALVACGGAYDGVENGSPSPDRVGEESGQGSESSGTLPTGDPATPPVTVPSSCSDGKKHAFCCDFDTAGTSSFQELGWTVVASTADQAQGSVSLSTSALSAPRAALAKASAPRANRGSASPALVRDIVFREGSKLDGSTIQLDIKPAPLSPDQAPERFLAVAISDGPAMAKTRVLTLSSKGNRIVAGVGSLVPASAELSIPSGTLKNGWMHLSIALATRPTGTLAATIKTEASDPIMIELPDDMAIPTGFALMLGVEGPHDAYEAAYDNVVIDVPGFGDPDGPR